MTEEITLRDRIAMHALTRAQMNHLADRHGRTISDIAYGIADQMMKSRDGRDLQEMRELKELQKAAHAVKPIDDMVAWQRYHNKLQAMYEGGVLV